MGSLSWKGRSVASLMVFLLLFPTVVTILSGCSSKRRTGTAVGAGTGAVLGGAAAGDDDTAEGAAIGAIAGGLAGYAIGRSLEASDQEKVVQGLKTTPAGETKTWTNGPKRFAMTPYESYQNESDQTCRDFTLKMIREGKTKKFTKTGCRKAISGKWVISNRE